LGAFFPISKLEEAVLQMKSKHLFIAIFGLIVISGCGKSGPLELTETPEVNLNNSPLELTETHIITGFNFSIDYPEGWFAVTEDEFTVIAETLIDFSQRDIPDRDLIGIGISLEHLPLSFLEQFGLPSDSPTLDDLFALNIGVLTGMTNPSITETTIFGVPALRSEYYEEDRWEISYAGFINNEAFFFIVSAPTEEMLNEFKQTFELMIASITPID